MKAIVNLDDRPGKTAGEVARRSAAQALERMAQEYQSLGLKLPYPKGVYRFKTIEEANAWEWKHMMAAATKRCRARRTSGTSNGFVPS